MKPLWVTPPSPGMCASQAAKVIRANPGYDTDGTNTWNPLAPDLLVIDPRWQACSNVEIWASASVQFLLPAMQSLMKAIDATVYMLKQEKSRGDDEMSKWQTEMKWKWAHERETLSAVAFSVKVRGLRVRWKQKLSAQCVVALLRCETNTKAQKSRFFLVYIFSLCLFPNYLWLWGNRNQICYSARLFTVYISDTECGTMSCTLVLAVSSILNPCPFIDRF